MFTGFASENTPAIQVQDFVAPFANIFAVRSVSLPDDCAPIQIFRTGAATTSIKVYLPTAPIEGKQITIVNQRYGSATQLIQIYSSDSSGGGTFSPLFTLGQATSITLIYSKQNISFGAISGLLQSGWFLLDRASPTAANYYSTVVGGDSNSATASFCFIGGGSSNTAGGQFSSVVGGQNNTTSSTNAAVVGGASNTASGTNAIVVGGSTNAASGNSSAVVGGTSNSASGTNAIVIGGTGNTASQSHSSVVGGQSNIANQPHSAVVGGQGNVANSAASAVIGGSYGFTRSIVGNFVNSASNGPINISYGTQQSAILLLARETTNATATILTSNTSAASTINQVILSNNSAYYFKGSVIANVTAGGDTKAWTFDGAIKRGATAASTTLVGTPVITSAYGDAGAAAWVITVTADTTNGGIAVTVTGAAATTIRWSCKIETTEIAY